MTTAERVLAAVADEIRRSEADLERVRGGTLTLILKVDAAGCPRQIEIRTSRTSAVERRASCLPAKAS